MSVRLNGLEARTFEPAKDLMRAPEPDRDFARFLWGQWTAKRGSISVWSHSLQDFHSSVRAPGTIWTCAWPSSLWRLAGRILEETDVVPHRLCICDSRSGLLTAGAPPEWQP